MQHRRTSILAIGVAVLVALAAAGQTAEDLLKKARAAFDAGMRNEALALVAKAIEREPKKPRGYLVRGKMYETVGKHREAVADFTKVIELDNKEADAYQHRGSEHFKLGLIAESLADFDMYLTLRPEKKASHWQRGISCYYAGKFKEGQQQFESYQTYSDDDVENAVWHYLCHAKVSGKEKARAGMLKVRQDKRVPMKEIYALFSGKLRPEEVLAAAQTGKPKPELLNRQLFYAHLYLGLYYESEGDAKKALHHLTIAADNHRVPHYMWDVARVHRDLLRKKKNDHH